MISTLGITVTGKILSEISISGLGILPKSPGGWYNRYVLR